MRTVWTSIFPKRFIPLPVPTTEDKLLFPKPKDLKATDKFPDLWKRMAIQSFMPETDYTKIPFDCPTVQKDTYTCET